MAEKKQAPTPIVYKEWQSAWEFFNDRLFNGELPPCLITLHRHPKSKGYFSENRFVNRDGETTSEIALNPEYFASATPKSVLSTLVHEQAHQWQAVFGKDKSRVTYHNTEWADKMTAIGLESSTTGMPGGKRTGEKVTHYIVQGGPFDVFCDELLATGDFVTWFDRHSAADAESSHFIYNGTVPTADDPSATPSDVQEPPEGDAQTAAPVGPDAPTSASGPAPAVPIAPATKAAKPGPAAPVDKPIGAQVAAKLSTPTARKTANGGKDKSNRAKYVCSDCSNAAWGKPAMHLICGKCNIDMTATAA